VNSCVCMSLYAPTRQGVGNTLGIKNTGLPVMRPVILRFLILSHIHLLQHGTKAELWVCATSAFHDAIHGILRAL
jgi:hypothetical protein